MTTKLLENVSHFFALRFAPASMVMENMMFKVDGVQVSSNHVCNEKFCTINLENLNKQSSGSYRCEISGDAPEFKLSHETANMTVAGEFLNFLDFI